MNIVVVIFGIVLMLPILIVVGIALGPAILVMLFVGLCALPVLAVVNAIVRHRH